MRFLVCLALVACEQATPTPTPPTPVPVDAPPTPVPVHAATKLVIRTRTNLPSAYRVGGTVEKIRFDFPEVEFMSIAGSEYPIVAPDNTRIAFVRAGRLSILDSHTLAVHPVPYTPPAGTRLLLTDWSSHGLLIYLRVDNDTGHYELVDVTTGTARRTTIPGVFIGWLAGGEYVADLHEVLVRGIPDQPHRELARIETAIIQPVAAPDGRSVVLGTYEGTPKLTRVDVGTGRSTVIPTPVPAVNPWPTISRSGKLAWIEEDVRVRFEGGSAVDLGGPIAQIAWLDDGAMILFTARELVVVDVATGNTRVRRTF